MAPLFALICFSTPQSAVSSRASPLQLLLSRFLILNPQAERNKLIFLLQILIFSSPFLTVYLECSNLSLITSMVLSLTFPWSTLIMKIESAVSSLIEIIALVSKSSSDYSEHSVNKYDTGNKKACRFCLIPSLRWKILGAAQNSFETSASFEDQIKENVKEEAPFIDLVPEFDTLNSFLFSPRPTNELNAAAVKLQKVYKSYRTRRNLADCAVLVEELWWKALDFASLKRSSISFFTDGKQETAASRWARARTRVAKVAKGLSKDNKAQKLAIQHWLEAIDPRHRYGHNLKLYYDIWFQSDSAQPFFYWLDIGDGKELNIENCPRIKLQRQCIKYLGPNERRSYEVTVEEGKLVYKGSGMFVNSADGSKWIFVLSTYRRLYVGQKIKGLFQHSSFLAGGATTAAGRLVAKQGILKGIWPYSGHYLPTEENFKEFINFLRDNNVDLTEVKRYSIEQDNASSMSQPINEVEIAENLSKLKTGESSELEEEEACAESSSVLRVHKTNMNTGNHLHCNWATGFGPRISCVREYPADLQFKALEQVNLSPKLNLSSAGNSSPIPSPRPSPAMRLSPRLAQLGMA